MATPMQPVVQHPDWPNVRMLLCSLPGGGKSTFAATFPTPILVLLSDPRGKDGPYLDRGAPMAMQTLPNGLTYQDVLADDGSLLVRIEHFFDRTPKDPIAFEALATRVDGMTIQERAAWGTIVFDSATTMRETSFLREKYKINRGSKDPRQWYAGSADALKEMLFVQLGGWYETNVIVICHFSDERDEATGGYVRRLALPGKVLPNALMSAFPEYYRMFAGRQTPNGPLSFGVQTERGPDFEAMSQVIHAPNPCAPEYTALWVNFVPRVVGTAGAYAQPEQS